MANTNTPYGFRAKYLHGTDPQFNVFAPHGYSIASAYSTSLFRGDPVKGSGTGDASGRPGIIIQSTAGVIRGAFAGVQYKDTATGQVFFTDKWTASTAATEIVANVFDHPHTIFSVQADGAVAITDIGQKADYVSGTGNALTHLSAYVLSSSSIATQDALLILGVDQSERNNVIPDSYTSLLCLIREHELAGTYTAT